MPPTEAVDFKKSSETRATPIRAPAFDLLGMDMEPGERVLGFAVAGEARAYPLRYLEVHEVVLDTFPNGLPVLLIHCPRTGVAVAYDRRLGPDTYTFATTSLRVRNSLVLEDDETKSKWIAFTGECVEGPRVGARLRPLPCQLVTWRAWTKAYPSSKVLRPPSLAREYELEEKWVAYQRSDRVEHRVTHADRRLHAKVAVAGFLHEGQPICVTMTLLDELGEVVIETSAGEIHVSHNDGFVGAEDAYGRELLTRVAYWFAWKDFHPDTRTFTKHGELPRSGA